MAAESKITIRVSSSRGATTVRYSTTGRYQRLATNGINNVLMNQGQQPTTSSLIFWESILPLVLADLTSHH
jgi:hypothetical protein